MTHQSHWGFRESPFGGVPNTRYYFESPTHHEALARLHFLVENRRRLGLLLGPAGSGKSLVFEVFAARMRRQGAPTAIINLLGIEPDELLWTLAVQLGSNPRREDPPRVLWQEIGDRITEHRYQHLSTVVLLDDGDSAGENALTIVSRLVQLDNTPDARLTLVVAADPQRISRLGHRLLDQSDLRIELEPWEEAETAQYLQQSVAKVGREQQAFGRDAVSRLHDLGQGVPRQISQLADLALLAGAGRELPTVDEETVDSAFRELSASSMRCGQHSTR